jgi:hypothetical protein
MKFFTGAAVLSDRPSEYNIFVILLYSEHTIAHTQIQTHTLYIYIYIQNCLEHCLLLKDNDEAPFGT